MTPAGSDELHTQMHRRQGHVFPALSLLGAGALRVDTAPQIPQTTGRSDALSHPRWSLSTFSELMPGPFDLTKRSTDKWVAFGQVSNTRIRSCGDLSVTRRATERWETDGSVKPMDPIVERAE